MISRKNLFLRLAEQSPEANNYGNSWDLILIPSLNPQASKIQTDLINLINSIGGRHKIEQVKLYENDKPVIYKHLTVTFDKSFPSKSKRLKANLKFYAKVHGGKLLDFYFNTHTKDYDFIMKLHDNKMVICNSTADSLYSISNCTQQEKLSIIQQLSAIINPLISEEEEYVSEPNL